MHIAYCIAGTRHSGGMERVLANKANWLVGHGHKVTVITTDQCGEPSFFEMNIQIAHYDLGINYEANNGGAIFNKIANYPIKQFKHKRKLQNLLMNLNADVVISMGCNEVGLLTGINDGSKKVLEIHFSRFKRLQYNRRGLWRVIDIYRHWQDKKIASRYDKFVVLTEEDLQLWGKDMKNINVIPNAHPFRLEVPSSCKSRTVLAVGRFTYQKGFDRLLDIWNRLITFHPDWKLRIVGNGELKNDYIELIKRYGIADSVTLVDTCRDIKSEYHNASIYAMTSHYEGLPMALLEAQASGLPIVSFACQCGPRDVVMDGFNGFLVDDGDITAFVDKLGLLMADDELRIKFGEAAYLNSLKYSTDAIMNRWLSLFSSTM